MEMHVDTSLSKLMARKIATDIISGKLRPGERITEDVYALEFGTSRAPVREALYLLSTEGLIERKPRRGAFVKKYMKQEIKDLYEIRLTLELMSIDKVIYPISPIDIGRIEETLLEMDLIIEAEDMEKYTELNSVFHYQIINLSKSEVYKTLYNRLGSPLMALQKISFEDTRTVKESFNEHKEIWNNLLTGNREEAKKILQRHNLSGLRRVYYG